MYSSKPYYAVIFTSKHTVNTQGYSEMAKKMEALAKQQKGYIGMDSARNNSATSLSTDIGITVSYWESVEAIKNWKTNSEHLMAQHKGRTQWYNWYNVRICKVEREYEFSLDG